MSQEYPVEDPFDERVLKVIRESPNYTLRPARLASQLSISHTDATEQLCGLLRAVGSSATFRFEEIQSSSEEGNDANDDTQNKSHRTSTTVAMTFMFPPDFESRARRFRTVSNVRWMSWAVLEGTVKLIQIVIAMGLILSLCVVTILSIVVVIAAFVAIFTQQHQPNANHRHRFLAWERTRHLFGTLQEFLWFYAVFGDCGLFGLFRGSGEGERYEQQQDPFFRDMARDISLWLSICCVRPTSGLGFWWRIHMLQQRQQQRRRQYPFSWNQGWGGMGNHSWQRRQQQLSLGSRNENALAPGVYVLNRGTWRHDDNTGDIHNNHNDTFDDAREEMFTNHRSSSSILAMSHVPLNQERKGFISMAVEFLFGPRPFWPGPTELQKWKLREYFIVTFLSQNSSTDGIRLDQLLPYCDSPPRYRHTIDGTSRLLTVARDSHNCLAQCLPIVSYFGGVPAKNQNSLSSHDITQAQFMFPELMLEAEGGGLSLDTLGLRRNENNSANYSWTSFFYDTTENKNRSAATTLSNRQEITNDLPLYLYESPHVLTKLSKSQFLLCTLLGVLNWIGILLLKTYFRRNQFSFVRSSTVLRMLSFFHTYALIFLATPLIRAIFIIVLNIGISERNKRRKAWADGVVNS